MMKRHAYDVTLRVLCHRALKTSRLGIRLQLMHCQGDLLLSFLITGQFNHQLMHKGCIRWAGLAHGKGRSDGFHVESEGTLSTGSFSPLTFHHNLHEYG